MLDREIRITIPGHPAPKGSLKCVGGRGGRGHILIEDNDRTKDWRDTIADAVRRHWPTGRNATPGQPLGAEVTFTLPRPKGHYGTGRNANTVKASAPQFPVGHGTGDVDKLVRLALDALQDTDVLPDDSAVVDLHTRKAFPSCRFTPDALDYPGIVIRLYPIEGL